MNQGISLTPVEVERIKAMLSDPEVTVAMIVDRTGRTRSAVHSVNRKYNIRIYTSRNVFTIKATNEVGDTRWTA